MRLTARGRAVLTALAVALWLAATFTLVSLTGGFHDPAAPDYQTGAQ